MKITIDNNNKIKFNSNDIRIKTAIITITLIV